MSIKEIAELIKTLSTEKDVSVEAVIMELQTSLITFDSLEFTTRTKNILTVNDITSTAQLCAYSTEDLKEMPLVSKKMILEVKSVLESRGLTLKVVNTEDDQS